MGIKKRYFIRIQRFFKKVSCQTFILLFIRVNFLSLLYFCAHSVMDNASDYESEDCRFDSCWARFLFWKTVFLFHSILINHLNELPTYISSACSRSFSVRIFSFTFFRLKRVCLRIPGKTPQESCGVQSSFLIFRKRLVMHPSVSSARVFRKMHS